MKGLKFYLLAIMLHLAVLFCPKLPQSAPVEKKSYVEVTLEPPPPPPASPPLETLAQDNPDSSPAPGPESDNPETPSEALAPTPIPETAVPPDATMVRQAAEHEGPATPGVIGGGGGGGGFVFRGHTFEVYVRPDGITWAAAQALAKQRGGHLAIIDSPEKNTFVFNLVNHADYWHNVPRGDAATGPWIGGYGDWPRQATPIVYRDDMKGQAAQPEGHPSYYANGPNQRQPIWSEQDDKQLSYAFVMEYNNADSKVAVRYKTTLVYQHGMFIGEHPMDVTFEIVAVPQGITWYDALVAAHKRGGELVEIVSRDENAFIFKLIDHPEYWHNDPTGAASIGPWLRWLGMSQKKPNGWKLDKAHFFVVVFPLNNHPDLTSFASNQAGWVLALYAPSETGYDLNDSRGYAPWAKGKPDYQSLPNWDAVLFYAPGADNRQPTWGDQAWDGLAYSYLVQFANHDPPHH